MVCNSCNKNLQSLFPINNLQPINCNNSMTKIYNYLSGKKIDVSALHTTLYPSIPPLRTWGLVDIVGETGQLVTRDLFYRDVSNNGFYTYTLSISIINKELITSCNSNPITDCMCIHTDTVDADGNISYDIPSSLIDTALSTLPITSSIPPLPSLKSSNFGTYLIIGSIRIAALYYAHQKKII